MSAGFQGSETSSVEVVIYRQNNDPISILRGVTGNNVLRLVGKSRYHDDHCLISVSTNHQMGPEAATWQITLKPSPMADEVFDTVQDDDWVDIIYKRHNRQWHTLRGLVDSVRQNTRVEGSGATSVSYSISGRCFTKVLEKTALYQDVYTASNVSTVAFLPTTIFQSANNSPFFGGVGAFVEGAITGYLKANESQGRTSWEFPAGMPNVTKKFIDSLTFNLENYRNYPSRVLAADHWVSANGMLWPWVIERADPAMTDVYTDIMPSSYKNKLNANDLLEGFSPNETSMTLIVRDKPFPHTDTGKYGPWFESLALFIVPREQLVTADIGKTGEERVNAFYMSPLVMGHQHKSQDSLVNLAPEWNPGDINRHGFRRWDLQTNWMPNYADGSSWGEFQNIYRRLLRDWHAINPYMLNGNLELGIGRPDLRVGHRLRIPGSSVSPDETYYIETLDHSWEFGRGMRTSVGVSRGWKGLDNDLLAAIQTLADGYSEATELRAKT